MGTEKKIRANRFIWGKEDDYIPHSVRSQCQDCVNFREHDIHVWCLGPYSGKEIPGLIFGNEEVCEGLVKK